MLLLLLACPSSPAPEPSAAADACADAVKVGWDDWGQGFFATWCGACHAAATPDRRGAPEGVDFDDWAQVQAQAAGIRRAVLDEATMPVGGGLSADDRARLDALLRCGEGGEGVGHDAEPPGPTLDGAGVKAAAEGVFAGGLPLATAVYEAYVAVLQAHADGVCPSGGTLPPYSIMAPMVGCTTADGWTFSGITRRESAAAEGAWSEWMLGDGWAHDPDGVLLIFGGEIAWGGSDDGTSWWQTLDGTWGWQGGAGWLAAVPSLALRVTGEGVGEAARAQLDGGWTVGDVSVYLDALQLEGAGAWGAVRVRDPAGTWTTVTLPQGAGGCGPAVHADGTALGEVCLDTSALAASLAAAPGLR